MKRLLVMTTFVGALDSFNRGIFEALRDDGFEVIGATGPGPAERFENIRRRGFEVITFPLVREPSPLKDSWCLIRLWWFLLWNRFDIVHCSTPKAMLLGTIAAFFSGHRKRVITVRGRVYETSAGWKRKCFVLLDKMTCWLANKIICVSPSLRDAMLADGISRYDRYIVFGSGSSKGVDANKFSRTPELAGQREQLCSEWGIPEDHHIMLFVGRVREDKGVNEMVQAFVSIAQDHPDWHLVLVGSVEPVGKIESTVQDALECHPQIHMVGRMANPGAAYAAAEMFILPTWREGFPNVSLEASAMELPVITTDAIGAVDSVIPEETGLIVPSRQMEPLARGMKRLMDDKALRERMGKAGRQWVVKEFRGEDIAQAIVDLFN